MQAKIYNIRLTFHPDQFVVLSSPHKTVVKRSIKELEYHNKLATLLGADVINIHGGGAYKNKRQALKRFEINFKKLSKSLRQKLTIENDDKVYTPFDLFPLCQKLKIPFVYDVHHHRCLKDNLTIEETTKLSLTTWNREPLFHISSPKRGWRAKKITPHGDYINPKDLPACWKTIKQLTIEVEAKAKELAVLKLKKSLLKMKWRLR